MYIMIIIFVHKIHMIFNNNIVINTLFISGFIVQIMFELLFYYCSTVHFSMMTLIKIVQISTFHRFYIIFICNNSRFIGYLICYCSKIQLELEPTCFFRTNY